MSGKPDIYMPAYTCIHLYITTQTYTGKLVILSVHILSVYMYSAYKYTLIYIHVYGAVLLAIAANQYSLFPCNLYVSK